MEVVRRGNGEKERVKMAMKIQPAWSLIALSASAFAGEFQLAIGNPIAATIPGSHYGIFVQIKMTIVANAEARRSTQARSRHCRGTGEWHAPVCCSEIGARRDSRSLCCFTRMVSAGQVVDPEWILPATKAGAVVPIGPQGYLRESSKFSAIHYGRGH